MIITLFTFGLSWAFYAFVFYGMTLVMPQFHSSYPQATFTIAFSIGFFDAGFLKALRLMNFKIHPVLLLALSVVINYVLIRGTNGAAETYFVEGHKAPLIVACVMAVAMFTFELGKEKFFSDVRL
jgi:K+ transporter